MLSVVTPATATNLTTLARARALLGFAAGDDTAVGILIDQASRAIADHCRRPFGIETVRETRECVEPGGMLLARSPVTAFAEVLDGSEIISPSGYRYDAEAGCLYRVASDGSLSGWWWSTALAVTYTAGYVLPSDTNGAPATTLPPPVERAAIRIVGAYLSMKGRDTLIKSETTEGVGSTTWWVPGTASSLPDPEAEQLLAPYVRMF
jgi:hypothetical protein